jgi:hypothetical protein
MYCPQCKVEYRQGFTRCSDCDVELVGSFPEAVRHPLAKKLAVGDEYGARLWSGTDPHFYVELLRSLWNKKVACYGAPENPPIPEEVRKLQLDSSESGGFEVWVSEGNLPLAKWILDSTKEEFEKEPPEQRTTKAILPELSPETTGVCPLCFGEFGAATSYCPNCGVPLRLTQPDQTAENSARLLCNFRHPTFIADLRKALQTAGIPFNNANLTSAGIIPGMYYTPNYAVLVLDQDFERARRVMAQVLQHWEFEPNAGLGFSRERDPLDGYWPVRATESRWLPEDISAIAWSGRNIHWLSTIGMALQENEIPYRVATEQLGTAKVFIHPEDEARAREIVQEVMEGLKPD